MNRLILLFFALSFFASCYTEIKKPDYKFMNTVKKEAMLDSTQQTKILITPKKFYFGEISASKKLHGDFFVKNIGKINFNIISIGSNCNCIQTTYADTKVIPPGDSLQVKYEMNIENLKGLFQNTIIVIGNCPYGNQTYYFEGTILFINH